MKHILNDTDPKIIEVKQLTLPVLGPIAYKDLSKKNWHRAFIPFIESSILF